MRRNRVRDRDAVRDIMALEPAAAVAATAAAAAAVRRQRNRGAGVEVITRVVCANGMRSMFVGASDQNEPEMKVYRGEVPAVVYCPNLGAIDCRLEEIITLMKGE